VNTQLYNQIFFTNVLRLIEERGWTKEQLSEISGVSISFISNLTNGRGNPSLRIMEQLADALDTPLPALLETTDLDQRILEQLSNGKWSGLPNGYQRLSVVLTDYHAYTVKKWAEEDQLKLMEEQKK
jgi:transcriptional regulator with XRE-family HTH domain